MNLLKLSIIKFYKTEKQTCSHIKMENVATANPVSLGNSIRQGLLENSMCKNNKHRKVMDKD